MNRERLNLLEQILGALRMAERMIIKCHVEEEKHLVELSTGMSSIKERDLVAASVGSIECARESLSEAINYLEDMEVKK